MKRLTRPAALKLSAILSFINSLSGFIIMIPLIPRGAAALDQTVDSPPYLVVITSFALSILLVIAAFGTWTKQRWGIILSLLVNAIGALFAAPAILDAPTPMLWFAGTLGVLLSIASIILCLWRDSKPAVV